MNTKSLSVRQMVVLSILSLAGGAYAGGTHAGGHGHDDEETAIGKPGVSAKVVRTVAVDMNDSMRYSPSDIKVKQGETIRFVIKNSGAVKHELSLGTEKELLEHLEQMRKFPDMEHDEPSKVSLSPGKQGEIVWQFTKAGSVNFACLMPGHFEAGMKGVVNVSKKKFQITQSD